MHDEGPADVPHIDLRKFASSSPWRAAAASSPRAATCASRSRPSATRSASWRRSCGSSCSCASRAASSLTPAGEGRFLLHAEDVLDAPARRRRFGEAVPPRAVRRRLGRPDADDGAGPRFATARNMRARCTSCASASSRASATSCTRRLRPASLDVALCYDPRPHARRQAGAALL